MSFNRTQFLKIGRNYLIPAFTLISSPSFSKDKVPNQWDLQQILDRATKQSPQLKSIENKIESSRYRQEQAGLWENPELDAEIGRIKSNGAGGNSLDVSIKQSLPLFGKKNAQYKVEETHRELVLTEKDKEVLRIRHEVVRLSYRLAMFDKLAEHIEHRLKKWDMVVKFLKSRTLASPSQILEKKLIQNRLREIEEKTLDIGLAREEAWQSLNVYLGLDKKIEPSVEWIQNETQKFSSGDLSLGKNLEIVQQTKNILLAEAEVKTFEAMKYPDLKLGIGVSRSKADAEDQSIYSILELSLPIFDRGQASSNAARSMVAFEQNIMEQKKREISSEFAKSTLLLANVQKKLKVFPLSLVDRLERDMDNTESAFRKSLVAAPSFLELENQVHEQTAKVYEVQLEYIQAVSNLLILSGQDFSLGVN